MDPNMIDSNVVLVLNHISQDVSLSRNYLEILAIVACMVFAGVFWRLAILAKNQSHFW